jgi:hypothetical protein
MVLPSTVFNSKSGESFPVSVDFGPKISRSTSTAPSGGVNRNSASSTGSPTAAFVKNSVTLVVDALGLPGDLNVIV